VICAQMLANLREILSTDYAITPISWLKALNVSHKVIQISVICITGG